MVRLHFQLTLLCFGMEYTKTTKQTRWICCTPQSTLLKSWCSQFLFNQAPFPCLHKGCYLTNGNLFFTTSYKFVKIQWQDWRSNYKGLKYSIWLEQTLFWVSFIESWCILGRDILILYNLHILNKTSHFFFFATGQKRGEF